MKDRMKVYHGIPKSVPDENTIFYASFDGSVKPEIGSMLKTNPVPYCDMPTGYGANLDHQNDIPLSNLRIFSIDFWIDMNKLKGYNNNSKYITTIGSNDKLLSFYIFTNGSSPQLECNTLVNNNGQGNALVFKSFPLTGKHFVRIVINNDTIKLYVNGKLLGENSTKLQGYDLNRDLIRFFRRTDEARNGSGVISDLHISNIDRGDFFPNLPQDFIEGKAIIKERFGQQQIKGDPMCSQVTELKIPHYSQANDYLYSPNNYLYNNPEAHTILGAENWNESASFKIKGLNKEVISGVIDSDTALGTVVKLIPQYSMVVDSVDKLSVGDRFAMIKADSTEFDTTTRTITEIDVNNKVVTYSGDPMSSATFNSGWTKLVEITASSSSPIVKTQDGQTVVGTWSWLGTNEATFTLGTNTPSLSGKDLYVTYSLNMSPNNSHFPEIPYSVDKAFTETGVEMKPVTEIVIEDDFEGKISGSTRECPHIGKFIGRSSLQPPNQFVDEFITTGSYSYKNLSLIDLATCSVATGTTNNIPQMAFSFNVIELVERKLGCIIPGDKITWLRNNVSSVECVVRGYGSSHKGNDLKFTHFDKQGNWSSNFVSHSNPDSNTPLGKSDNNSTFTTYRLCDDGFVHYLAYCEASNGSSTQSRLDIDYIVFKLKLNIPSGFQALYCDNKRVRGDICNPVLMQKETKTIQRLIPSKECFVTESTKGINKSVSGGAQIFKTDTGYLSSQGTGGNSLNNDNYTNCLAKLGFISDTYRFNNDVLQSMDQYPDIRFVKTLCQNYYSNNDGTVPEKRIDKTYITLHPFLTLKDGELILKVQCREVICGVYNNVKPYAHLKLPNRPLIK